MGKNCSCCCHDHGDHHDHEHSHSHTHSHDHSHDAKVKKGWRLFAPEIYSSFVFFIFLYMEYVAPLGRLEWYGAVFLALLGAWPLLLNIVRDAWPLWRRGDFMNEFTLMLAAAIGAFAIGEYPEGIAVLLFYSLGEKLEDKASDNVRSRVRSLLGRLPNEARVERQGEIAVVKPEEVEQGETILVRPGDRVPIDGLLQADHEVEFDTSAITGESVPRSIGPGEEVLSGMIPIDRDVRLTTSRPFADSSMSRIMQMIEESSSKKSKTETMLRRITRWYTPTVFILALLLFVVPWIVSLFGSYTFEWHTWFERSLVFLVCSCPCALVVSVPLSYFAAIGAASRQGILFKGGKYIDVLTALRTVAFDKTGTITTGDFHVSGITPAEGFTSDEILATAAAVDSSSSHPLAKAIVAEAKRRNLSLSPCADALTVPHGMKGTVAGKQVIVGSEKLMRNYGEATSKSLYLKSIFKAISKSLQKDCTLIHVAIDGKFAGTISLLDNIKPEAASAIHGLHEAGVKRVVILSGDRPEAVERVAGEVGADEFEASLLPEDKSKYVAECENEGRILFVGDGINDAPALAAASVGVAMGIRGTGMALESADIVLSSDNLESLPKAIHLAHKVRNVVIQNVSFAIGIKLLVMTLGAFGIATLWAAVFADTGVTLLTVLWTVLRLRK